VGAGPSMAPGAFIVVSLFGNAASIEGLEQHGDPDVVTQSLHATIEKIVAAAIRLVTKNHLPDLRSPPSVATIGESPEKARRWQSELYLFSFEPGFAPISKFATTVIMRVTPKRESK
jgi:hypothetical protein